MGALPGGWELVLILLVVVMLFGAKRMPDAARGLGRSLRIFKAETKGLHDDATAAAPAPGELTSGGPEATPAAPAAPPAPQPTVQPAPQPTAQQPIVQPDPGAIDR